MDMLQNLAKQALEATGGKSTLKATQWILDRRAEVQQQEQKQLQLFAVESENENEEEELVQDVGKESGEEERGSSSVLSSSSQWGCSLRGTTFGGESVPDPVRISTDRHVSGALERHLSFGSSSRMDCPFEFGERQSLHKYVKLAERSKTSCSPEPNEDDKIASSKLLGIASAPLPNARNKRRREDEADTSHAGPLPVVQTYTRPIALRVGKGAVSMAERMQPTTIAEILGQDHLLGPRCVLRSLLDEKSLPSTIFWGPPGSGKTSLARLISRSASCRFVCFSPASGIAEIQEILDEAKQAKKFGQRTILFVESLSEFNKSQQDCVLPSVEAGYVIFLGATTENPTKEVVSGLLLRCRVFTLKKLQPNDLCILMKQALSDKEKGVLVSLGDVSGIDLVAVEDDVIQFLANVADGDARVALNGLEAAVCMALDKANGWRGFDVEGKSLAQSDYHILYRNAKADRGKTGREAVSLVKADTSFNVLEHLKGYFQFSQEEYTRPFKRIMGGKEVTGTATERAATIFSSEADVEGRGGRIEIMKGRQDREIADQNAIIREPGAQNTSQGDVETRLLVTLSDAKEAIKWPDSVLDKGSEDIGNDLIVALLKAVRGGDSNAAVYWLARILENREGPLLAANALLTFASEQVGMADPQALVQAVACYQACQFLGMKGCSAHLTQCAVYLSMAPKSAALPQAFQLALKAVQDGHHDPVPSHLLRASGGLEDKFSYLPASLHNVKFLRWPVI